MARNVIYEARKLAGLTQADVAKKLGVNQSTYSNKERLNDFTAVERKNLIEVIGQDNMNEALNSFSQFNDASPSYDNKYKMLLSEVNKLLQLQRAGILIQAEILSRIDGLTADQALDELKKLYEEKTGQKVDI